MSTIDEAHAAVAAEDQQVKPTPEELLRSAQQLLQVARRLHLQAERRLFPPERPRPQAEDAVVPVVVADVAVPHQRDRNRLRLAC